MSREDAIEKLKSFDLIGSNEDIEFQYALDMGIEALEKINKIDKIAHIRSVEDLNGLNCEEAILGLFKTVLEPCESEDIISRQAAIDAIENYHIDSTDIDSDTEDSIKFGMATALNIIQQLPTVTPAEKVGQWIEHKTDDGRSWLECPLCHIKKQYPMSNYCPYCGSKNTEKDIPDENGWVW